MDKGKGLFKMMSEEKKRQIGRILYEAILEERRHNESESADYAESDQECGANEVGQIAANQPDD